MSEENNQETTVVPDSLLAAPPAMDFSAGKPEGFPDDFWDAEKKAPVVDKLFDAYTHASKRVEGLRAKLARGEFEGKAPDDIKEYTVDLSDDLKQLVPDDDVLLMAARESAKQAGLPKDVFNKFVAPVVAKLAELKAQAEPTEPTEEQIAEARNAEIAKLGPTGSKIVSAVNGFIDQLESEGRFSKIEAEEARNMATTAEAVRVLNKFRMMTGGNNVPVEVPIDVAASRHDIATKMAQAMAAGNEPEYNKFASMLAKMNN